MDAVNVYQLDTLSNENMQSIEADTFWCMSYFLSHIQVRTALDLLCAVLTPVMILSGQFRDQQHRHQGHGEQTGTSNAPYGKLRDVSDASPSKQEELVRIHDGTARVYRNVGEAILMLESFHRATLSTPQDRGDRLLDLLNAMGDHAARPRDAHQGPHSVLTLLSVIPHAVM